MALTSRKNGVADRQELARHYSRFQDDLSGIKAAALTELVLLMDKVLAELQVLNARIGCPNFIAIPRHLKSIARDANRRNRRVDLVAAERRRRTRQRKKE